MPAKSSRLSTWTKRTKEQRLNRKLIQVNVYFVVVSFWYLCLRLCIDLLGLLWDTFCVKLTTFKAIFASSFLINCSILKGLRAVVMLSQTGVVQITNCVSLFARNPKTWPSKFGKSGLEPAYATACKFTIFEKRKLRKRSNCCTRPKRRWRMGKREGERSEHNNSNEQECDARSSYYPSAAVTAALEAYRELTKSTDGTTDKYSTDKFDKPNFGYYKDLGKQLIKRGWWSR